MLNIALWSTETAVQARSGEALLSFNASVLLAAALGFVGGAYLASRGWEKQPHV